MRPVIFEPYRGSKTDCINNSKDHRCVNAPVFNAVIKISYSSIITIQHCAEEVCRARAVEIARLCEQGY